METVTFRHTEGIAFTTAQRKSFSKYAASYKYKIELAYALGISRQTLWNIENKWQANRETIEKVFTVINSIA